MAEGVSLVVSEVETADLPTQKLWMDVLCCKDQLHRAQGPLKINVSTLCGLLHAVEHFYMALKAALQIGFSFKNFFFDETGGIWHQIWFR